MLFRKKVFNVVGVWVPSILWLCHFGMFVVSEMVKLKVITMEVTSGILLAYLSFGLFLMALITALSCNLLVLIQKNNFIESEKKVAKILLLIWTLLPAIYLLVFLVKLSFGGTAAEPAVSF